MEDLLTLVILKDKTMVQHTIKIRYSVVTVITNKIILTPSQKKSDSSCHIYFLEEGSIYFFQVYYYHVNSK